MKPLAQSHSALKGQSWHSNSELTPALCCWHNRPEPPNPDVRPPLCLLCLSLGATAKCHRRGSLNNRNSFSHAYGG